MDHWEARSKDPSTVAALRIIHSFLSKKLALDCSGQQIAVDLFVLQNQHCDLATISGIAKFSGGQVQVFPGFHATHNHSVAERFDRAVRR